MNPLPAAPRKFTFDTVFDGERVITPPKPKRTFTLEELEAARADAYAQGQRSVVAQAEAQAAQAEQPVLAALEALSRELDAQPRLLVRASPANVERLTVALTAAAESAGFAGLVVVKADPGLPPAAFSFDWGEGRAAFDPAAASARVEAALETALAAEGLHAEPIVLNAEA